MRIGVDLGGTKIEAVVLDGAGRETFRRRVPTPAGDYDATVAAVAALVRGADAAAGGAAPVGIGIPGTVTPATGLVRNANSTCLNGRPLRRDLERALGREVRLANDANCFALSEATDGAGEGARVVFGAILGTGTGGGVVVDGRLVDGRHGVAGEWGHAPLPWMSAEEFPGPPCFCGKRGCVETFLSGPGVARDHETATGERLAAAEVAARAASGDPRCRATLGRHADRLARALAAVVHVLDPDVVVLGGGLSNVASLYEDVPPLLARHVLADAVTTRIVPARHGDASGVRGAAWLWPA